MLGLYVRYRSPVPNMRGARVGVFALANGLAAEGLLDSVEATWLRTNNDWYNAAYGDPSKAQPDVFDRSANPITECWFKASATHLLARVDGYLRLLDAHGVAWEAVTSDRPGMILYEDEYQVVVAPKFPQQDHDVVEFRCGQTRGRVMRLPIGILTAWP
ncbi:MAG: hypothetical protein QM622_12315 [Microbacterium sp.]